MNFLNLLETRTLNDEIINEIKNFEIRANFKMPLLFKAYQLYFNPIDDLGVGLGYVITGENKIRSLDIAKNNLDGEILIYSLFEISSILDIMQNVYPPDDLVWQAEMIPIGECAFQTYLMVGVGENNKDKIYTENATRDEDKRIVYLCDNIFELFHNYLIIPDETKLPNGVKLNQLYKNWGEDFWRIRDEQV